MPRVHSLPIYYEVWCILSNLNKFQTIRLNNHLLTLLIKSTFFRAWNSFATGGRRVLQSKLFLLGRNPFLVGSYKYLFQHISIKLNFLFITSIDDRILVSVHPRIWPGKAHFWPAIVLWSAVISSPVKFLKECNKFSCYDSKHRMV